jgi:hypothetical protein
LEKKNDNIITALARPEVINSTVHRKQYENKSAKKT